MPFFFNPLDPHVRSFLVVREMLAEHHDLLAARWFSMVPYLYGEGRAVKYAARPCNKAPLMSAGGDSNGFLSARLARRLTDGDAYFEFILQFQRDAETTSIGDATALWHERSTPLVKVVRLEIPAQSCYRGCAAKFLREPFLQPLARVTRAPAARRDQPRATSDLRGHLQLPLQSQ